MTSDNMRTGGLLRRAHHSRPRPVVGPESTLPDRLQVAAYWAAPENAEKFLRFSKRTIAALAKNRLNRKSRVLVSDLPYGGKNGRAKLTRKAVEALRKDWASGRVTQRSLAARYGISCASVARIISGQQWPHVERGLEWMESAWSARDFGSRR